MCLFPLRLWSLSCATFLPVALVGNLWNRSPFLFSKKRAHFCTDRQEEMRYEGSPVMAPPLSRRRMTQLIEAGAPHWNGGAGEEAIKKGSGSGERSAGR